MSTAHLTEAPVQRANEALAQRVRFLEGRERYLLGRLQKQATTINRLLEEQKQATTIVVDKHPQLTLERQRAVIDQQRERIHQQNQELRVARDEIAHNDELIVTQREALNRNQMTIRALEDAIVELSGETHGLQNERDRLRKLAACRLDHIVSLEEVLEGKDSLMSSENLAQLEEHILEAVDSLELLGDVVKELLDKRTRP